MRFHRIRRFLISLAMGGCLLASSGCPDLEAIRNSVAANVEDAVTDVIGLYITAAIDATIGG